jgi:hypothetical protein
MFLNLSTVLKHRENWWNFTDISEEAIASAGCLLLASIFLGLLFDPECAGDMFLLNVGWFSTNCRTLRCIPEGITLHSHLCENFKENIVL